MQHHLALSPNQVNVFAIVMKLQVIFFHSDAIELCDFEGNHIGSTRVENRELRKCISKFVIIRKKERTSKRWGTSIILAAIFIRKQILVDDEMKL